MILLVFLFLLGCSSPEVIHKEPAVEIYHAKIVPTATPTPTATPQPTASPAPTPTPTPLPIRGTWFVQDCAKFRVAGLHDRDYYYPYAYALDAAEAVRYYNEEGHACAENEIWNSSIVPNHRPYVRRGRLFEENLQSAKKRFRELIPHYQARERQIRNSAASGSPPPPSPEVFLGTFSSFHYGVRNDLQGGFKEDGKLKEARALLPVLPGYVDWLIAAWKKLGVTRFHILVEPYGWASRWQLQAESKNAAYPESPKGWPVLLDVPTKLSKKNLLRKLITTNPRLWPPYKWTPNELMTPFGFIVDEPNHIAFSRDATYYMRFLYALKGQYPEITGVTSRFSNGVYPASGTPWEKMAVALPGLNRLYGYDSSIQIDAFNAVVNRQLGGAWSNARVDCSALDSVQSNADTVVSTCCAPQMGRVGMGFASCGEFSISLGKSGVVH